jgi:hypothetical protein
MDSRQDYKGFVIEAKPEELADGTGWTENYIIKINRFEGQWFGSDQKLPTKAEATSASILAAKRKIDRSLDKLGRNTNRTDVDSYHSLSATWPEDEHPLAGGADVHYTKDNRRQRLDEVDSEPE